MSARRTRISLRGWGGVAAMAVACALTAVLALLLPLTRGAVGDRSTGVGGPVWPRVCRPEPTTAPIRSGA